jgi:hypothetical protein
LTPDLRPARDKTVSGKPHPPKVCATCSRLFEYRKKWARDWANVRYCSDKCRRVGPAGAKAGRR